MSTLRSVQYRQLSIGSPKVVNVSENRAIDTMSKFSCRVRSGNHQIISDLTKDAKGDDSGLSPKEMLLASVGSCTAMTIRTVFENSKAASERNQRASSVTIHTGWSACSLDEIRVEVQEWGDDPHIPTNITIKIELIGNLNNEQKKVLLKKASHCPVKSILSNGILISTALEQENLIT